MLNIDDGTVIELDSPAPCSICQVPTRLHVAYNMDDGTFELRAVCSDHLAGELAMTEQKGKA